VPLAKTAVRLLLPPAPIDAGLAVKLVIAGAGTTVMVAVCVTADPLVGVTVSVYVVVAAGLTVIAVPLVTATLPGVITPDPFTKVPVNVAFAPAVMVAGLATKAEMEGTSGGGVVVLDEPPPQPVNPPKHTLKPTAHTKGARIRFIVLPRCGKFWQI
jgi:hypothetical protein